MPLPLLLLFPIATAEHPASHLVMDRVVRDVRGVGEEEAESVGRVFELCSSRIVGQLSAVGVDGGHKTGGQGNIIS